MTGIGYRFVKLAGAFALALTLGGCLPGGGNPGAGKAAPGQPATTVITGDAIESTPLGPPGSAANAPAAQPAAAGAGASPGRPPAPGEAGAAASAAAEGTREAAAPQAQETPAAATAEPAAPEPEAAEVLPPETNPYYAEARLVCEKAGGSWKKTGNGFNSCVWSTKDSGKRCTASTQCDGACLARSGTCAPFKPLFGCNEILDDSGRSMTECLQ